ncbi:hypothetical protein L7F22_036719 [Adiantum nelumboides]|nr:hypothetical protein [Adiantum nelumboides]
MASPIEAQAAEPMMIGGDDELKPRFQPLTASEMNGGRVQFRKVLVPPHRYTPLKQHWMELYTPVYEQMKIDIRMNLKVCHFIQHDALSSCTAL